MKRVIPRCRVECTQDRFTGSLDVPTLGSVDQQERPRAQDERRFFRRFLESIQKVAELLRNHCRTETANERDESLMSLDVRRIVSDGSARDP